MHFKGVQNTPNYYLSTWGVGNVQSPRRRLMSCSWARMAKVVTIHDDLLTKWRHINSAQMFFIQTNSNYFQLLLGLIIFPKSEVQKSLVFIFPVKKNIPNWKHELISMQSSYFINKIKNLHQLSEKYFPRNGL